MRASDLAILQRMIPSGGGKVGLEKLRQESGWDIGSLNASLCRLGRKGHIVLGFDYASKNPKGEQRCKMEEARWQRRRRHG